MFAPTKTSPVVVSRKKQFTTGNKQVVHVAGLVPSEVKGDDH